MVEENRSFWPGWETVRRIGSGGFGTVYEIQRDVYGDLEKAALKVITIPHSEDEVDYLRCTGLTDANITQTLHKQVADIAREYKLMAQMRDNPNVVRCDDFRDIQHEDGLGWDIYIKMELLTPLMKCLDKVQTEKQILKLGMDICNVLIACQEKDIIHRDIKPQNIFISEKGQFKLGDFGIARTAERTTRATAGIGTYSYMAPEVEKNEAYGKTADIYSLGLVLYWLLNEKRSPFMPLPPAVPGYGDEENARNRRFRGEQIPAPKNGSEELKAIVLKACAYDPKERYQSAKDMLLALEAMHTGTMPVKEQVPIAEPILAEDIADDELTQGPGWGNTTEEPATEDNMTVGPSWRDIPATEDNDVTVGPVFNKKEIKQLQTDPANKLKETQPKPKKKKWWFIAGVTVAVVGLLVLMLALTPSDLPVGDKPQANAATTSVPTADASAKKASVTDTELPPNTLEYDPLKRAEITRENIRNVTFLNTLEMAPSNAVDVSAYNDGSVLLWTEDNGGGISVFVAAEGEINARYCEDMFNGCIMLETVSFGKSFNTEKATSMEAMFYNCPNLRSVDVEMLDTSNVTSMKNMFALTDYDMYVLGDANHQVEYANLQMLNVSGWDTANVRDMSGMFTGCKNLEQLDVSAWNLSSVTDLGGTFAGCEQLETLDVSSWNISEVTNMYGTFCNCYNLKELDVSNWNTSKVTSMRRLFSECQTLETLDVENWDTSSVIDMGGVFEFCENIRALDVGKWDVSNVTIMNSMFRHCIMLTALDVANWDTSKVERMSGVFCESENLKEVDVSNWNVSNAQSMDFMFWCCDRLQNLTVNNWDTSSCTYNEAFMHPDGRVNGRPWKELFEQ